MVWIYLIVAGLFEIGWPLGLKLSQTTDKKLLWIVAAVVSMSASGLFLWLAQKSIPLGTAYAVWTGIGAVGAFVVGILLFKDPATLFRIVSVTHVTQKTRIDALDAPTFRSGLWNTLHLYGL